MADTTKLKYIVNHAFFPPQLPQKPEEDARQMDLGLARQVLHSARRYHQSVPDGEKPQWDTVIRMLVEICASHQESVLSTTYLKRSLRNFQSGGILVFLIHAQNAGIIMRKQNDAVTVECFEVSPTAAEVTGTKGKLLCHYPASAVAVPVEKFEEKTFRDQFASFLARMDVDVIEEAVPVTMKGRSNVVETRDSANPRFITELLVGILRGVGKPVEVKQVRKRIGDEALSEGVKIPWRRSSLWLVIRVALQTSLRSPNHAVYKSFMAFMLSDLLQLALHSDLESDLLFCMRAKVSRRLFKIGNSAPDFVQERVVDVVDAAGTVLQQRWSAVQDAHKQALSPQWAPNDLDVIEDTGLSLNNSRDHIQNILGAPSLPPIQRAPFTPRQEKRYKDTTEFRDFIDGHWTSACDADRVTALVDFEEVVRTKLGEWVVDNIDVGRACDVIGDCIGRYQAKASVQYASDPAALSVMFLTVFDLWMALDRIATAQFNLLLQYSPEVPLKLVKALLLRKSEHLEQLARIERYLGDRQSNAVEKSSIFSDDITDRTVSVRYFSTSNSLKALKLRIERDASKVREKRCSELRGLNRSYDQLMEKVNSKEHSYTETDGRRGQDFVHDSNCRKCHYQNQANALTIEVHEWPLPEEEMRAQTVVFELGCPAPFRAWRDTTYKVLHDICVPAKPPAASARPSTHLDTYAALVPYIVAQNGRRSRITLASTTKSVVNTQSSTIRIPATESQVCVPNGLHYKLFDSHLSLWAGGPFVDCDIREQCTLKLLKTSPYHALQVAVSGFPSSNWMLANQSLCPKELSLHEFLAFGSIRSGHLIQWLNIIRELRARTLRFSTTDVHTLLMQSAWQVGSLSSKGSRAWHVQLEDTEFCLTLLGELEDLLDAVKANWLEGTTVRTVIFLATRALAATKDEHVVESAYGLLRKAREVTAAWIQQLSEKLQARRGDDGVTTSEFRWRVCEMAATCRSTYDVDDIHLRRLLSSEDDVNILVQCAVTLRDNIPPDISKLSSDKKQVLTRDRRLSYALERALSTAVINQNGSGLDLAIRAIWEAYRPGQSWTQLPKPNDRWFVSRTAHGFGQQSQQVHYNVLDGQLLIDGKPLGRLPTDMVRHATYSRIFGQTVLDIIPSDMPGLEFKTRRLISGYEVYFLLRESDLVVRAKRPDTADVLELIPGDKLADDLPELFVQDNVHWLNLSNRTIELRPLETLWVSSPKNWHIHLPQIGRWTIYRLSSPSICLVDVRSRTFTMFAECIKPLERRRYLHVELDCNSNVLSLDLPRFKLQFFVNAANQIESKNLRGMVIDSDQSVGSLVGLSNQLVLRPRRDDMLALPRSRRVIIPQGEVDFRQDGHHIQVDVTTNQDRQVKYYEYKIDTDLGYLVSNVNLTSRYYLLYLHALTSHCLPDPLTGRTGTEEAMHGVCSAHCLSFQKLGHADAAILRLIGSLSPVRTYYPAHLRSMQTVKWSSLPPVAQHDGFHTAVTAIFEYAESLRIFRDGLGLKDYATSNKADLLMRAVGRNAYIYPQELSGLLPPGINDSAYSSRDRPSSGGEALVCGITRSIEDWEKRRLDASPELIDEYSRWKEFSGPTRLLDLGFNREWLELTIKSDWMSLCATSIQCTPEDRYRMVFVFSALAYSREDFRPFMDTCLAFATIDQFQTLSPPPRQSYSLGRGITPKKDDITPVVLSHAVPFDNSREARLPRIQGESNYMYKKRRTSAFDTRINREASRLVEDLAEQWPCETPQRPPSSHHPSFALNRLIQDSRLVSLFGHWYRNRELHAHTRKVQALLDAIDRKRKASNGLYPSLLSHLDQNIPTCKFFTFEKSLECAVPAIAQAPHLITNPAITSAHGSSTSTEKLRSLLSEFKRNSSNLYQRYGNDLDESRKVLDRHQILLTPTDIPYTNNELLLHRQTCGRHVDRTFSSIANCLSSGLNKSEKVMLSAGLSPRITPKSLLQKLASTSHCQLPPEWKSTLISFAKALLWYQRSQRLLEHALQGNVEEFWKELENTGTGVEGTLHHTDWLLIQIEANILIRPIQAHIAKEMLSPSSGENTVLQLNMGEGKSAVIVPIVASASADRSKLVRVVVLKPLAGQMFHLLIQRLSGLTNRRIFHMPFSRSVEMNLEHAQRIQEMYETCMRVGGILVVQPEHMLSFKLMGIDKSLSAAVEAPSLLNSQIWLEANSRDILDESDEILQVRYQLVYTTGNQRPVEDHPDRWVTIQQVLTLARNRAAEVLREHPQGLEFVEGRREDFAPIRIFSHAAGERLVNLIAKNVLDGALPNYTFELFPEDVRRQALTFITNPHCKESKVATLRKHCDDTGGGLWKSLLLLRGLFAHGILVYVLKERRWRVDYGLDPSRSLLAVPYRAKDVPAVKAEFGHPDVCIALTCLSYYYLGLTKDQIDSCFQRLYKLGNPVVEYEKWVRASDSIPESLRQLNGVNTEDPELYGSTIVPLFSRNFVVINFFLSHVVFPKEAKEFPKKLSTSGWDIAERKTHVTTGFSGTNDNRYLLPTSIEQRDPEEQLSTNAKVLNYLLRPENGVYVCAQTDECERLSAESFLGLLVQQKPEVRILLDVGAQMLELRNESLALHWLSLQTDAQAALFFDDHDELMVVTRDGAVEAFVSSPFNQQLDQCLVYLDDAHTRGTDLKLPRGTRAAVTLGPKVTKDRLLQGCMRMRGLGAGHSVMFFAPPEVERSIRETARKRLTRKVEVIDILRWVMHETCAEIQRNLPRWAQQGQEFSVRDRAWRKFTSDRIDMDALCSRWLTPEAQTLHIMYGIPEGDGSRSGDMKDEAFKIPAIRSRCLDLGVFSLDDTRKDEEQEREISHEIEREVQIERPPQTNAATHRVHPDLKSFIRTGVFPNPMSSSPESAFTSAFTSLANTSAGLVGDDIEAWPLSLLATWDFTTTIQPESLHRTDEYLRPVQWLISSTKKGRLSLVVCSPFEVNALLSDIRQSKNVHLHIYTPRVTQAMKSCEDLKFYCIPPLPTNWNFPEPTTSIIQLNLFAGQLYHADFRAYVGMCEFLGVYTADFQNLFEDVKVQIDCDGFVSLDQRMEVGWKLSPFTRSPVPFVKELFALRRKGANFLPTHMGKILHGKFLTEDDFD
ncbi:hypothetical protein BD410DRAFT_770925 [Rickenella mellea]|uniref:ubiquitinyl hydrolase 1 n=1 Tax=Rickenella mellea TaxID=50990 RepID=A0A4Y7Q3N5_9AGAM|nr:hypothetical protein BD410DRAFT_770925 [Rickenella mellea]